VSSDSRRAVVSQHGRDAGILERSQEGRWRFAYFPDYGGPAVSLSMPVPKRAFEYESFPPAFEGLLPEGPQLEALLRKHKIDRSDYFRQLLTVGEDLVGSLSFREFPAPAGEISK